jgi:cytochrome c biogenesis protein CcdA
MSSLSGIGLLTSFGAGVISFLSPCVLPLVPGYVSYVAGDALTGEPVKPLAALGLSLFFVFGFSTVFVILGASATTIGQLLLSYRQEENLVGGAVVLLLSAFMMALAKLSWLQRDFRLHLNVGGGRPVTRVHHRSRVRLRLDALYRAGARCDPDHERRCRHGAAGHHTPRILLARVGPSVPRRSRIHRPSDAAA